MAGRTDKESCSHNGAVFQFLQFCENRRIADILQMKPTSFSTENVREYDATVVCHNVPSADDLRLRR
ncbi:MAG: hypothetical protein AAGI92_08825 [Pseudomonadota bacterium]